MTGGNNEIPIVISIDSKGAKSGADQVTKSLDDITAKTKITSSSISSIEKAIGGLGVTLNTISESLNKAVISLEKISETNQKAAASFSAVAKAEKELSTANVEVERTFNIVRNGLVKVVDETGKVVSSYSQLKKSTEQVIAANIQEVDSDYQVAAAKAALSKVIQQEAIAHTSLSETLKNYNNTATKTIAGNEALSASNKKVAISSNESKVASFELLSSLAKLGLLFGAIESLKLADQYEQLQGKLRVVTESTKDYALVSSQLYDISIKTGTTLNNNVTLFQQLSIAAKGIGASNQDIVKFVENFDKVGAIYKLDGTHLNATILDLSHSLETGTVHAAQFNRLLIAFPAIRTLVDPLKGSFSSLDEAVKAGAVSSKELFRVLQEGLRIKAAGFEFLPPGLARSLISFKEAAAKTFGDISEDNAVLKTLAGTINLLANNMGALSTVIGEIALLMAVKYTAALVGATAALITTNKNIYLGVVATEAAVVAETSLAVAATEATVATGALGVATNLLSKAGLGFLVTGYGLAFAGIATAIYLVNSRTTNLQDAQENHTSSVKRGIEIYDKLKTAHGDEKTALEKEQQALINTTNAQIESNKAKLRSLQRSLIAADEQSNPSSSANFSSANIAQDSALGSIASDILKKKIDLVTAALKEENKAIADNNQIKINGKTTDEQAAETAGKAHENAVTASKDAIDAAANRAKNIDFLKQEIEQKQYLAQQQLKGNAAYDAAIDKINAENAAREAGFKIGTKQADQFITLYKQNEQLDEQIKNRTQSEKDAQKAIEDATKAYEEQHRKMVEAQAKPFIQAAEDIQRSLSSSIEDGIKSGFKKGYDPVKEFANVIKDTLIKTLSSALAAQLTNQFVKPLLGGIAGATSGQEVGNSVNSTFGNGNSGGGSGGLSTYAGLGKSLYSSVADSSFGQYIAQSAFGQGVSSAIGSVGSALGLTSATSSLASGIGSVGGLASGAFSAGGLGASAFGAAGSGSGLASGSLGLTSSYAGAAGSAGSGTAVAGAAASTAGSYVLPVIGAGLTAYSMYTSAMAGQKVGAGMGAAQGAISGAAIGSVVPGIGTAIGAVIGAIVGAIGGSLGPSHPKAKASEFATTENNGTLSNSSYGSKGLSQNIAKSLVTGLGETLSGLKTLGVNFADNMKITGGVNSNYGSKFVIDDGKGNVKRIDFDPSTSENAARAMAKVAVELAKTANVANGSLTTALKNIQTDGRDASEILKDIAFAAKFDNIGKDVPIATRAIGAFEQQALDLKATYDDATERTKRLGLSLDKLAGYKEADVNKFFDTLINGTAGVTDAKKAMDSVTESFADMRKAAEVLGYSLKKIDGAEKAATQALRNGFLGGINEQIMQITNPAQLALDKLDAEFNVYYANARDLGASTEAIDELHRLRMQEIINTANQSVLDAQKAYLNTYVGNQITAQSTVISKLQATQTAFANFATSLTATRNALLINPNLSNLSPAQQLATAKSQYETVLAAAKSGDQAALGGLESAGQAFLDASKSYNASSTAYFADFSEVLNGLQDTAQYASQQADIQTQQLTVAQKQLDALQAISDKLNNTSSTTPQVDSSILAQNPNQTLGTAVDRNKALIAVTNFRANFGGGAFESYIRQAPESEKAKARAILTAYGQVPGFASGGDFGGGLRMVGERGPELEITGPSHIYNNAQTKSILAAANGNDSRTSAGVDRLVTLMQNRINQSAEETNALRSDLSDLQRTNEMLASKVDRLLSRAK